MRDFEEKLAEIKPTISTVSAGVDGEHQRVSIPFNSIDNELKDQPANDVLQSLKVELLKGSEVLSTSDLRLDKYSGTVKNATPAAFHYFNFPRTADEYPISWDRGAYIGGVEKDGNYMDAVSGESAVDKPDSAKVTITTKSGKTIIITSN